MSELSQAQRKLQAAVEDFVHEEWGSDPNTILTTWAMVTHHTGWNDDGDAISSYGTVFMNGDMADHQAIGLFHLVADRLQHSYNVSTTDPRDSSDDE